MITSSLVPEPHSWSSTVRLFFSSPLQKMAIDLRRAGGKGCSLLFFSVWRKVTDEGKVYCKGHDRLSAGGNLHERTGRLRAERARDRSRLGAIIWGWARLSLDKVWLVAMRMGVERWKRMLRSRVWLVDCLFHSL